MAENAEAPAASFAGPGSSEQHLTATEYRLLVEHSPVMIWRADLRTRCDCFNHTWLEFTARTLAEEAGDGWATGVHPDDLERCVDDTERMEGEARGREFAAEQAAHEAAERKNAELREMHGRCCAFH